jgi:hypothetical protein
MKTIKESLVDYISNLSDNDLKKFFDEIKLKTDRPFDYRDIKTYEDALNFCALDKINVINDCDTKDIVALKKLRHIYKAINNGWVPDYTNSKQYKYYPWFKVLSSGLDCSDSGYGYDVASTDVGVRLCTDTAVKAEYIGKTFKDLYKDYLL